MTNQFTKFTKKQMDFSELTDIIYNDLLKTNNNIKSIKIFITFYNKDEEINKFFFFRFKTDIDRYAFRNFFYNRYTKFINKYIKIKIDEFVVEINYSTDS